MWLEQLLNPNQVFAMDACLTGISGLGGKEYFHAEIPQFILDIEGVQIAHLELLAVLVGLKLWAPKLTGTRFKILCDNSAV